MAAETATIINDGNFMTKPTGEIVHQVRYIYVEAPATADAGDTVAITLSDYGLTTFWGILGWKHTTDDSVCVAEEPTTAVSAGVLTITLAVGTDNDPRFWIIYGV